VVITIYLQLAGILSFFIATLVLGRAIRRTPTKDAAVRLSRVSHGFFWGAMMFPEYLGLVWPGLTHFDELLGLPPLPFPIARWVLGVPLLLVGVYFASNSIRALRKLGAGLMAFKLTQQVVGGDVYERVRNPMSLGLYLQFTAVALLAGSTYLLAVVVLAYIPAHAFNLKYFEELELSARHGPSYDEYRARVPFLVPRLGRA
jgi:protein-S-isoprenylcysteine O-methyltransferase Ste14